MNVLMQKQILAAGFLLMTACTATAQPDTQTLKIATLAPDGTSWMQKMRESADEIATKTGGRVRLKLYPGGVMGSDKSVLRKIRIGQLQGGAVTSGALAEVFADAQIYSLPFQFQSTDQVTHVRKQLDGMLQRGLEKSGFISVGLSGGGFAYMFSRKPIRSVENLKGQRVWIPEGDVIGETVFEIAGIKPVPLPLSDVFTALQTGLLDVVVVNPTGAIAFQWHAKLKYMTDVPLIFLVGMVVIDKKAFNRLSVPDQKIVRETMQAKFKALDILNHEDDASARRALQKAGVEFISLTGEEKASWQKIADDSLQALAKKQAYTEEFFKALQWQLKSFHPKGTVP